MLLSTRFKADLLKYKRQERFEDQQILDVIRQVYDQMNPHGDKERDNVSYLFCMRLL